MMIYLDHASTTPVDKGVLKAMLPYFSEKYGNSASICEVGREAKNAVNKAKTKITKILGCKSKEIIFTGSGTESVNLALKGVAENHKRGHIIISNIEHSAVINTAEYLSEKGFKITKIKSNNKGEINPKDVKKAIKKDTILISIMYANNEIGTIQNIKKIGEVAQKNKVIFHTDACQAGGALNLNVNDLKVDLMTLNGSKIYGPKGIGLLYKSEKIKIAAQIHGGDQEGGFRSGTQNIPLIVGFAEALELAEKRRTKEHKSQIKLRDFLIKSILKEVPETILNGHPTKRLPNNINISFAGIEGETILMRLDMKGICASSGSACASGSVEPSHVISALGIPHENAHSSVRFTIGRSTTKKELEKVIKELKKIVKNLREFSPMF